MKLIIHFLCIFSVSAKLTTLPQSPLTTSPWRSGRAATRMSSVTTTTIPNSQTTLLKAVPRGGVTTGGSPLKLLFGVGGIYGAFMYYGLLQEAVFKYQAVDGSKFEQVWFLMVLEAFANVIVGFIGQRITGTDHGLPLTLFAASGLTQVCAKAFTNLALSHAVSFPVVTLAKSGKMVPVMIGSILLGGSSYAIREYLQVMLIIGGTCVVSMAKKSKNQSASSGAGLAFIALSLICDGLTGGLQKRLKQATIEMGIKIKPYDMMFWTNWFMMLSGILLATAQNQLIPGFNFIMNNPDLLSKIASFALCSAIGQSFIFFTLANFEPLVCTTVTTTRKIFSVLLSIFVNKHQLNAQGWSGIAIACLGILGELQHKASK